LFRDAFFCAYMKMEEVKMVDHKWFEEKNGVNE
jgi:hypothetical protein